MDDDFKLEFTSAQVAQYSALLGRAISAKNKVDAKFWVIATLIVSESRIVTPTHNRESEA